MPPALTSTRPVMAPAIVGKDFGTSVDDPAADATAWSLVGLLFFCIACFIIAGLVLRKQRRKPDPLDGFPPRDPRPPRETSPPWEKPDDWWKK